MHLLYMSYECKTHFYMLYLTLILQPPHLGAGTSLQIECVNHSLHPLITLLSGHVTWQAEGSRKLQVLSHAQSSHHNVILHVEEREREERQHSTLYFCGLRYETLHTIYWLKIDHTNRNTCTTYPTTFL